MSFYQLQSHNDDKSVGLSALLSDYTDEHILSFSLHDLFMFFLIFDNKKCGKKDANLCALLMGA